MKRRLLIGAAIFSAVLQPAASVAGGTILVPHRATYEMKLGASNSGSQIVGIDGRMVLIYEASCDGWSVQQLMGYRVRRVEGPEIENAFNFSSWESHDGKAYSFSLRVHRDRELVEELRGAADLEAPGGPGKAVFTKPDGQEMALPEGSIFPTEHILRLIESAQAGEGHFTRPVFDGASLDGPFEVSAFIGPETMPEADANKARHQLTSRRSWPMRLAYFKVAALEPQPDFEISVRLFDNGVADNLIFDYGDFAIGSTLQDVEELPAPDC